MARGFRKTAKVTIVGRARVVDGLLKVASGSRGAEAPPSYYLDGAAKIDVRKRLAAVADKYAISADPSDYIFEVIRANTVNVPNENDDGFHRNEVLRFDISAGVPVYLTYVDKPHHVDHRTDNPKWARGVIIDAHYNDDSPAAAVCPNKKCRVGGERTKTALRQNRDASGLHCRRCGATVKDEFVEILVGIDTKKDPVFAKGVQTGQLRTGSMGCSCLCTVCNVCHNVAYAKNEFCEHIRSPNKGSLWARTATKDSKHSSWRKLSVRQASDEMGRHGSDLVLTDLVTQWAPDGFEVRKAFEYCEGVVYDEYSRVDQPADRKAEQRQILRAAGLDIPAPLSAGVPDREELERESRALIAAALEAAEGRRMAATASQRRRASKFYVVRVDGNEADTYAAETLEEALELAAPDEGSRADYCEVEAPDAGAARLQWDEAAARPCPMDQEGRYVVVHQDPQTGELDSGTVVPEPGEEEEGQGPGLNLEELGPALQQGPPGEGGGSIEDLAQPPGQAPQAPMTGPEVGMIPPGASSPRGARGARRTETSPTPFGASYKHFTARVTAKGQATVVSPAGPVFVAQASRPLPTERARRAFGAKVLRMITEQGVVRTAKALRAHVAPKVAQVVDYAINDLKGYDPAGSTPPGVAEDELSDRAPARARSPRDQVTADDLSDMQQARSTPSDSLVRDRATDHELSDPSAPDGLSVLEDEEDDMRTDRRPRDVGKDDVLSDGQRDYAVKAQAHRGLLGRTAVLKTDKARAQRWRITGWRAGRGHRPGTFTLKRGRATREVSENELLQRWLMLDKVNPAAARRGAQQQHATSGKYVEVARAAAKGRFGVRQAASHVARNRGSTTDDKARFEARLRRHFEAREAKLRQEHEAVVKTKEETAFKRVARAVFIADHRQRLNVEPSPLKRRLIASLTQTRIVGQDEATGQPLEFTGLDPQLATFLVEAAFTADDGETTEKTLNRAAELMERGDQYLLDAERDLQTMQPVQISITAARQIAAGSDQAVADAMRAAVVSGNPQVTPTSAEAVSSNGHSKRSMIKSALGRAGPS